MSNSTVRNARMYYVRDTQYFSFEMLCSCEGWFSLHMVNGATPLSILAKDASEQGHGACLRPLWMIAALDEARRQVEESECSRKDASETR